MVNSLVSCITQYYYVGIFILQLLQLIIAEIASSNGSNSRQGKYDKNKHFSSSTPTLVQFVKIYSGSKDKDCAKFMHLRTQILMQGTGNRMHKTPATDIVQKILQHMIVREYLKEERKDNFNGFASFHLLIGRYCIFEGF